MAKNVGSLAIKIFSIFLFAAVAGVTLFFAYGYRYDIEEMVVQKTSIIDITTSVRDVAVFLDGKMVGESLPYQIKGVLPGFHTVALKKEGFLPWEIRVLVKEDIVTIVYNALPVPSDLDDFWVEVVEFREGEGLYYADDYVLSFVPGEKAMNIVKLFPNGNVVADEISLYREDFAPYDLFSEEKFLIRFEDSLGVRDFDLFAFVSFSDREFKLFALPKGTERIRVEAGSKYVFFLNGGNLYSVPFGRLADDGYADLEEFLMAGEVTQFDTDYRGNVFYLSSGMLYRKWYNGKGENLMDECPACYENMAIHVKGGVVMMVLREVEGGRKLFVVNRGGLKILTADLAGYPYVNGRNEIIYADGGGRVFVYDTVKKQKLFAGRDEDGFEIAGWFGDDGQYLVKKGEELYVYDIFGVEPVKIMSGFNAERSMVRGRTLYTVKEGKLYSLYFDEAYKK